MGVTAELFLQLVEVLPEALLLLSGTGVILGANGSAAGRFGVGREKLAGTPLSDWVRETPGRLGELLRTWSRSRDRLPGALTLRGPGGKAAAFRCEGSLLRPRTDSDGALLLVRLVPREAGAGQFLALNQKIDELTQEVHRRRQVEGELRRQRELLGVTLTSIGDGVLATDTAGRVTFLNPAAEALTGWPSPEAAGRPAEEVFRVVHEATREPLECPVPRVLREGMAVPLANHSVLVSRDGGERAVEDSAAPIRSEDGKVLGAVLVFHDVSERRAMQQQLKRRAAELLEADRRKDEFLTMLAHELRNPLGPIRNALEVLRRRGPEQAVFDKVRPMMDRQVRHLARIVEDLLDVSRITQGTMELRRERLDLAELVRTTAEDFRAGLEEKGLSFAVGTPAAPVWVEGDPIRLAQILYNLIDNAGKFTLPGGSVAVELAADPAASQAVLRVRDTGEGISSEMLARLFQTFAQADTSLHRSKGGLGLGLALIRGLARLHGGEVSAASEGPSRGAEFAVRVPLADEAGDDSGEGPA